MADHPTPTVNHLRTLPARESFKGVFLLRRAEVRKTARGGDFLSVELGDRSGNFKANIWSDSPLYPLFQGTAPGSILEVKGQADYYNDAFSPKLQDARQLEESEAVARNLLDTLVAVSAEDPDALLAEIESAVALLEPAPLRETVRHALSECGALFRTSPAAISMHHAYRHGLLEHTVHMVRCARALLPLYPEADPGLTLAGVILHDLGKVIEYGQGLAPEKTRPGLLQGHVVLGYRIVRKAALQSRLDPDRAERLEHIILSHQGELEWGAAVKAATPEAVLVSMIDNLDAKMGMVQEALRQATPGREFSDFLPGLGAPLLLSPLPPPPPPPAPTPVP